MNLEQAGSLHFMAGVIEQALDAEAIGARQTRLGIRPFDTLVGVVMALRSMPQMGGLEYVEEDMIVQIAATAEQALVGRAKPRRDDGRQEPLRDVVHAMRSLAQLQPLYPN